jgi:hypothetical protein
MVKPSASNPKTMALAAQDERLHGSGRTQRRITTTGAWRSAFTNRLMNLGPGVTEMGVTLKVPVNVMLPDGRGLPRALIESAPRGVRPKVTTYKADEFGATEFTITWPLANPRARVRTAWTFKASGFDEHGVRWEGRVDLVVDSIGTTPSRKHDGVTFELRRSKVDSSAIILEQDPTIALVGDELGELILDDVLEMRASLEDGLPSAALGMVGKVLDGFLKWVGTQEKWWVDEFDSLPLGALLERDEVKAAMRIHLGPGYWDRLRGSAVYVRNVAVHQKYAPVTIQEAVASAKVVLNALNKWR